LECFLFDFFGRSEIEIEIVWLGYQTSSAISGRLLFISTMASDLTLGQYQFLLRIMDDNLGPIEGPASYKA
jgi:hypothetical protein